MNINTFVGEKIRHFRKLKNMNQTELAQKLEITQQALGLLENGKRKVSPEMLYSLSKIFDKKIDEFFPER